MRTAGWTSMMVLASLVSVYALVVLFDGPVTPRFVSALRRNVPWAVAMHLAGGLTALAIGPWQLNSRLRARAVRCHRWMGRTYVGAVAAGGAGAIVLAPRSQEGTVTHVGFGLLAVLWLFATVQAYRHARARDFVSHRQWMIRSFALTFAAVMLRILLPLLLASGLAFHDAYQVVAWLCWVPNLVVAEWIVLRRCVHPAPGEVTSRSADSPGSVASSAVR